MFKLRITLLSADDEQLVQSAIKSKLSYLIVLMRTIAPEFDIEINYVPVDKDSLRPTYMQNQQIG